MVDNNVTVIKGKGASKKEKGSKTTTKLSVPEGFKILLYFKNAADTGLKNASAALERKGICNKVISGGFDRDKFCPDMVTLVVSEAEYNAYLATPLRARIS